MVPVEHDEREYETQAVRQRQLDAFLIPRLRRAQRLYSQAITGLLLGNAGAALATLSFIGATWHDGGFHKALLWPLAFFVLGLIVIGTGMLGALVFEARAIANLQGISSPLDIITDYIQSPVEKVELTVSSWRTGTALISGCLFVCGCLAGFILLLVV